MCDNLFKTFNENGEPNHPNCLNYYDGFAKGDFNTFNKGKLRIFDGFIQEWKMKKDNHKEVLGILQKKNFKSFLAYFQITLTACYYGLLTEYLNTMMNQLKHNQEMSSTYISIVISISLSVFCLMLVMVVAPIQKILMRFRSTLIIFPIGLMEKNMIIRYKILKLKNTTSIYNL